MSPNQIGHSADDKDDEENQTHLKQSVLQRDAYLHCAQCCYVMIDRKASVQLTYETDPGLPEPKWRSCCSLCVNETKVSANSQKIALEAAA